MPKFAKASLILADEGCVALLQKPNETVSYKRLRRHHDCTELSDVPIAEPPSLFRAWRLLEVHEGGLTRKIFSYCDPQDVYHMSLATRDRFVASTVHSYSWSAIVGNLVGPINHDIRLHKESYLNETLVDRLCHRLSTHMPTYKTSMPHLSLSRIIPSLEEQEKPGVVLSGSLPLQAVVGRSWSGCDVDLFCIESHVNRMRHILIHEYEMICCTFWHMYDKGDNVIHHVESYAARPSDYSREDMDRAIELGYELVNRKDMGDNLHDWCLHHSFPFDSNLPKGFVQIIVGKKTVRCPYTLTQSFDINVCRVAYDGRAFSLPWETNIFRFRARLMTRHAQLQEYLHSYLHAQPFIPCYIRYDDNEDDFWVVNSIHRVWKYMTRGFSVEGLPDMFANLANHPIRRDWLVFDPTRIRSPSAPLYPSQNAADYASPHLCGATFDSKMVLRFHRRTCVFVERDWPYAEYARTAP